MPKNWPYCYGITVRNRLFEQAELVAIRRLIRRYPTAGRTRLSVMICEELGWLQHNGRPKDRACRVALLKLEQLGLLSLPPRMVESGGKPPVTRGLATSLGPTSTVTVMPSVILLERVETTQQSRQWNWLIARYHYLGLATPVGRTVRYLIKGDSVVLGAIGFSECAWNVKPRKVALEAAGLPSMDCRNYVIGNNRFLLHPNVSIKNFASLILSRATRQVRFDWLERYNQEPLVVETFVDPSRYAGTCYLAANWLVVGTTKGYSKKGGSHENKNLPKLLLLRGLRSSIHRKLEAAFPPGMKSQWTEAA